MKNSLKLFGSTLNQVCEITKETLGDASVSSSARALSSAIALAAAMTGPAFAQNQHANQLVGEVQTDGRADGNTTARVVGGAVGSIAGLALTKDASGLAKVVTAFGLGYIGQSIGDILTRNATDKNGNPVIKVGYDQQGHPIYEPLINGMTHGQAKTAAYHQAIKLASANESAPPISVGGKQLKQLESSMHTGLYSLMVDAAAKRAVAILANNELDRAEMNRAISPSRQTEVAFSIANDAYRQAFIAYTSSYRKVDDVISIAQRSGFDVSAQQLMMSELPGDISRDLKLPIHWPGVDQKIREIGDSTQIGNLATFNEYIALGKSSPKSDARNRQRQ